MTETLADYVRRIRNDKGLSTLNIEERTRGEITNSYVSKIENGRIKNVSPEKLKILAKGLGVPEEEIFRAARGAKPKGSALIDEINSYLHELTTARQRDMLNFVKMFHEEAQAHKLEAQTPGIKHIVRTPGKKERKTVGGK